MYQKTVLSNSTRVVTEKIANVHSISLGICITTGSRNETSAENGVSHFIEHLFFKGTTTRTAKDIAVEIDSIGGECNAFTGQEFTYFYVRFIDEHLEKVWALLLDVLKNSQFGVQEIEMERQVILEEIKSFEDSPTDQVFHRLAGCLFESHPLGFPIMGPRENIKKFTRTDLIDFRDKHYTGSNLIIGAAGNIEHERLVNLASLLEFPNDINEPNKPNDFTPISAKSVELAKNELSQIHIAIGIRTIGYGDKIRYPWIILNTLLGSGMSSRLFQRLREKEGLVYEVNSFLELLSDIGIFAIYLVTDPQNVAPALNCVWEEFKKLNKDGLEQDELERTKAHLKGNLLLSLESTSARMLRILSNEMHLKKYVSMEETIENIEKVDAPTLLSIAQTYLTPNIYSISKVGPSTTLHK
ncbi:MAG: insulinase family protein [Candidatus Stahlbacteria bacterium]|nr:insulinase family protein [Candidatus Stahlbacteria bacterium]